MPNLNKYLVAPFAALILSLALSAPAPAHDAVIKVSLWDKGGEAEMPTGLGMGMGGDMSKATMGIKVSMNAVEAGKVTFDVTNDSKDAVHEMVVGPIKSENDKLPYNASENEVDEDSMGDLGEVSELDPGQSGSLTLNMKPGKYILYCNISGHYVAGMWTVLTVK